MGKFLLFLNRRVLLSLVLVWIVPPVSPASLPAAPSDLSATAVSQTRINLSWTDNSTNEEGFKIERSPDGLDGWLQIGIVSAEITTFADPNRSCGSLYYYRVRAYNGEGDSEYSDPANTSTFPCTPVPPSELTATAVSPTQIDLEWTDSSDNESSFEIERSPDGSTGWMLLDTVGADVITYHHTNLICGIPYYYRVRAVNSGGSSGYSNTASATIDCAPSAPTNLEASPVSAAKIDLAWEDNNLKETGYTVERLSTGGTWLELAVLPAGSTVYSDTLLTCNTLYTYRVYAFNIGGSSPYSNQASATTWHCLPAAPSELRLSLLPGSPFTLHWKDNSGDEAGFKIERSTDGSTGWEQVGTVAQGITTYTDSSATPGVRYYYRVAAYNETGDSGYSNIASTGFLVFIPILNK